MKNLDLLAAQTAQTIIRDTTSSKATEVENLITKALGVLQENGVYAAFLYLHSRSKVEASIAEKTRAQLLSLTSELGLTPPPSNTTASSALQFLTASVCNDLDRLLLVKQVWEQTLIYARYGAKARGVEEKASNNATANQSSSEQPETPEVEDTMAVIGNV